MPRAYAAELEALDVANKAKIETIPAANRKLVTFHDAFPYFARHYGFEVIGVILANVGQEPSATELAALVETVKAAGVKAVFSEAQFSPELAQTLAEEAGVTSVVTDSLQRHRRTATDRHVPHDDGVERRRDREAVAGAMPIGRATAGGGPALRDVTAGYGDRVALADVDLEIPTGSLLAVIGPNGSGKSTLLKTIAGAAHAVLRDGRGARRPAATRGQADRLRARRPSSSTGRSR